MPALLLALLLIGSAHGARLQAQAADTIVLEREITAAPAEEGAAEEAADTPVAAGTVSGRVRVIAGNRTIREGEIVEGITVIGGNARIRGEIRGDAEVVGGNLTLHEGGHIHGDVIVVGGNFQNRGGRVDGEIRTMDRVPGIAAGATAAAQRETRPSRRGDSAFGRIGRGMAGVVSTLALGLVLAAAGAGLVFYGHRYLDTVNDTIRTATLRSGAVGLAALFLVLPFFVILIVALAVTVIGIPLLLVAIPLYPLVVAAAAAFGLLAAAHAIGERTSEQKTPYDSRYRNSYAYLFTGLALLFAPVLFGYLVGMTPFLGWVGTLIRIMAYLAIWVATVVGFGAVILSRAGTRRIFADPLRSPLDDSILDDEPLVSEPRV